MKQMPNAVLDLVEGIERLCEVNRQLELEWAPDAVPITVCMSALGRSLAAGSRPTADELRRVFERVEILLARGDDSERDAVATGFLEALVSAVERDASLRWVLDQTGPAARGYIAAWNGFCGVAD
jgi:hypothetical protein